MPNEYSVEIHDFISDGIAAASRQLNTAEANNDLKRQAYWQGQLDEFTWLRSYLGEHTDLKGFTYYR